MFLGAVFAPSTLGSFDVRGVVFLESRGDCDATNNTDTMLALTMIIRSRGLNMKANKHRQRERERERERGVLLQKIQSKRL